MNDVTKISETLFNYEFDKLFKYKELGNQKNGLFYQYNTSNLLQGKLTIFYKGLFGLLTSKKKRAEIDFKDGLIHGTIVLYEKNAEVWLISEFKNGIPDGEFILFCPFEKTREHLEISLYKQGECISKETFPPPSTIRLYTNLYINFAKKIFFDDEITNKASIEFYLKNEYDEQSSKIELYKENPLFKESEINDLIEQKDRLSEHWDKLIDGIYNKMLSNQ